MPRLWLESPFGDRPFNHGGTTQASAAHRLGLHLLQIPGLRWTGVIPSATPSFPLDYSAFVLDLLCGGTLMKCTYAWIYSDHPSIKTWTSKDQVKISFQLSTSQIPIIQNIWLFPIDSPLVYIKHSVLYFLVYSSFRVFSRSAIVSTDLLWRGVTMISIKEKLKVFWPLKTSTSPAQKFCRMKALNMF